MDQMQFNWMNVDPHGGSFECNFDDVGWDLNTGDVVRVDLL